MSYFISHSSEDFSFVEDELIGLLEALGIEYWYSKEHAITGEEWERSIKNALEECEGFVLVMSPHSASSKWVRYEVSWAMENKPGRVFPVLYKECRLEDFHVHLPRIQYADFYSDEKVGRNRLIELLKNVQFEANSRASAIEGVWLGEVEQRVGFDGKPLSYSVEFRLDVVEQKNIKGSVVIEHPTAGDVYFRVTGGFLYERFVQLNYHSQDPGAIQFGATIMELNAIGDSMVGKFVGYGAFSQRIVDGDVRVSLRE